MSSIDPILARIRVTATVFHNGHYCGSWAVDTSGSDNMSFHVVTHGQCCLQIGETKTVLSAGDAVFFPNDSEHTLCATTDEFADVNASKPLSMQEPMADDAVALVCGYFKPQSPIFNALSAYFPDVIIIRRDESKDSAALIDLMITEAKRAEINSNGLLDRFADCLFYLLFRDHLPIDKGLFAALSHPKLEKAMQLIHADSAQAIDLESMAATAGMSRSTFTTLFKETLGQSPKEYLTQWRMTQAYEWLVEQGISTYEAALKTGYENEASFSKAFKRVMGVGPGAVRLKQRQPSS